MNNPRYAIYKEKEWDDEFTYFKTHMHNKIPVNEAAKLYEIDKIFYHIENGFFGQEYIKKYKDDDEELDIPELDILIESETETNKIYVNDPNYLIYEMEKSQKDYDKKICPHNRPAIEFNVKHDIQPYDCYDNRIALSDKNLKQTIILRELKNMNKDSF